MREKLWVPKFLDIQDKFGYLKVGYIRYELSSKAEIKYYRLFGHGLCMQNLSKEARKVAIGDGNRWYGHRLD